jgi:reverse gyrase
MIYSKACPRCHGDLYEERDRWGNYIACAQCGKHLNRNEETALKAARYLPVPVQVRRGASQG